MKRDIVHDTTDITADRSTVVNFATDAVYSCRFVRTDRRGATLNAAPHSNWHNDESAIDYVPRWQQYDLIEWRNEASRYRRHREAWPWRVYHSWVLCSCPYRHSRAGAETRRTCHHADRDAACPHSCCCCCLPWSVLSASHSDDLCTEVHIDTHLCVATHTNTTGEVVAHNRIILSANWRSRSDWL